MSYVNDLAKRVIELENALEKIEKMCGWIERDCMEADKVLCETADIRFEIAKVYPKYMRGE